MSKRPQPRDAHEKPSLKQMRAIVAKAYGVPLPEAMTARTVREAYREMMAGKQARRSSTSTTPPSTPTAGETEATPSGTPPTDRRE